MNYKKVIAYNPDTSVLFQLDNGTFALVAIDDEDARYLITVSKYAESFLKFGGFESGENIPADNLKKAEKILSRGAKVFYSKDLKLK